MNPSTSTSSQNRAHQLPENLARYLSPGESSAIAQTATYLDHGGDLIGPAALRSLHQLRPELLAKIGQLEAGTKLRSRLELLATFCEEAANERTDGTPEQREAAFALLYFLKGFDRIPDTVPEIGLLDDALIVQTVLQRHAAALRAHWLRRGRAWPADDAL